MSADPRPLIGQMSQYWPLIGCRSGVRPTADLLLSSSLPSIDLSSRQVASKACPAPCTARPGTRRGTQGAVGRHTARRTQSPCQENIQGARIVAYFLLHSELRLRSVESGTECSIETGMDSPKSSPSTPSHKEEEKLPKVVIKSLLLSVLDDKCASWCHVNPLLLETHDHAVILTQFSVYFERFIFWVSPYYQLHYNWAAGPG